MAVLLDRLRLFVVGFPRSRSPIAIVHGREEREEHQAERREDRDVDHPQAEGSPNGATSPFRPKEADAGDIQGEGSDNGKDEHPAGDRNHDRSPLSRANLQLLLISSGLRGSCICSHVERAI